MMRYSSALLLALIALAIPSQTDAGCSSSEVDNDEDIVSIVCKSSNDDRFGTLCDLLRETNIDSEIATGSDYFLFAPNNVAFSRAGNRAGFTIGQKQSVLRYHISRDDSDLECGQSRDSLLSGRTSVTRCVNNDELDGQEGNVRVPNPSSSYPRFVDSDDFISACNGKIAELGDVMGFGPAVFDYGSQQGSRCSFYNGNCKGSKGGGYPAHNYGYRPAKSAKNRGWRNFNRYQSVYAYNSPYVYTNYRPYYNQGYNNKGGKGYGYRRGPRYSNRPYYNSYYYDDWYGAGYRNRDLEEEKGGRGSIRGHIDGPFEDFKPEDFE
mmetsp:Transcript_18081/g.44979  ORF Transcript_18081/g.44979 Transcript_18081/m.44979 type:complete len:322 (+) Transcript_18081:189-1154(+)